MIRYTYSLKKIRAIEDTDEPDSDEPYVLVFAANITRPEIDLGGMTADAIEQLIQNSFPSSRTVSYGPWTDVDSGEERATIPLDQTDLFPLSHIVDREPFWGISGKKEPIPSPDDALFLVAVMENEEADVGGIRSVLHGLMVASLFSNWPEYVRENITRDELRERLKTAMRDTLKGPLTIGLVGGFIPNHDDLVGVASVPLEDADLLQAENSGTKERSDVTVQGDGGKYRLFFELRAFEDEVGQAASSLSAGPVFGRQSLRSGGAIAREASLLDALATDVAGRIWQTRWPDRVKKSWIPWQQVLTDIASPHTPVGVVSRSRDKLDIFITGQDGAPYTGAWDQGEANGQWRGWWKMLTGVNPAGGMITAVSREARKLDVFLVSNDGKVYTAAWDQHVAGGRWRGWWPIEGVVARPGAQVAAVARDPDKLDIFVTAVDGKVYTAAWDQNVAGGKWRGWWSISDLSAPSGAPIHVVSRKPHNLDIFVVGNEGGIWTAAWDQHVARGKWRGWWRVDKLVAQSGTPVTVVSREPHNLDIFAVGRDNKIYTAAWDQHVARGKWRGWWLVKNQIVKPGSTVAAVSRSPLKLDIFVVGADGKIYTAAWDHHAANGEWQGWWPIGD